jgi:hypothetical protein
MTFSASVLRKAALLAAFALVAGYSATALAQVQVHSLTGNARYQIGNGLPIPIGFTAAPVGRVHVLPGALVTETTGPDPQKMILAPSGATAPGNKVVIGLFAANPALFQVATAIPLAGPKAPGATFSAGGRTGATTVTWCPGTPGPAPSTEPSWNPSCAGPAAGSGINGLLRYTSFRNQFGGQNQGNVGGYADIAIRVGTHTPANGTVTAEFAIANPYPTGAQGGPFGFVGTTAGAAPAPPNGKGVFNAGPNGTLLTRIATNTVSAGVPNPATTYGAPWTTGRVTVSVTANEGAAEVFTFTGSDNRVNGVGTISLVCGGISDRGVSGPNGNRGWLNLTVGPVIFDGPIPAVSHGGLAAVFGLLALAGGYALHRKGRR